MKKLHKRTILVASAVGVTAATIGISASVVYATNDTLTKAQIAQNVEHSLEDKVFGTIKLRPASKSGTFHEGRLEENEAKLKDINDRMEKARQAFTLIVKERMPIYGIINDVLNVSSRFKDWNTFITRARDAIKAINNKDYRLLKDLLFDEENGGAEKILSKSYGVKRSDLEKINVGVASTSDSDPFVSYKAAKSFASFGEYVDKLIAEGTNTTPDTPIYRQTIVAAINIMTGKATNIGDDTSYGLPNADQPANGDSIVYMLQNLKTSGETNINSANLLKEWNEEILPAWNRRYQSIDQFFDDIHEPFTNKPDSQIAVDIKSDSDLAAFKIYDDTHQGVKTSPLPTSVDQFLDGNKADGSDGYVAGRFLTNWDFLRLFFGDSFEKKVQGSVVNKGYAGARGIDSLFSKNNAMIYKKDGTVIGSAANYWNSVITNMFSNITFKSRIYEGKPAEDRTLWTKLTYTKELEEKYLILESITNEYKTEVAKINSDSFAIGIKLDDLKEIISSFKLTSDWEIKINSLLDNSIDQKAIDDLTSKLKHSKDGSLTKYTTDYVIDKDGYIFPNSTKWTLRSTDTLNLKNIHFKDNSKLKPFEHEEHTITIFKPYIRINEDADEVSIDILWDHITGDAIGGHNDK